MDFISALLNSMPGAVTQGLIWGIMAIGVYITFRILDIADLTVDGSLCTGGAVCGAAHPERLPHLAGAAGRAGGGHAGRTGHRHLPHLLRHPGHPGRHSDPAGPVLHQPAHYGLGHRKRQPLNLPISVDKYDLMVSSRYVRELSLDNPLPKLIIFLAVIILVLLYWFFGTETGCALRATGANENMAKAQGINTSFTKVLGLMISNGLVALSGGLLSQYQGFSDINMGRGRHRHRTGRRHHRRGHSGTGLPQLRPQAGRLRHRRHHLLYRHPVRAAPGPVHRRPETAHRPGGGGVPGHPLLEGQILQPPRQEGRAKSNA